MLGMADFKGEVGFVAKGGFEGEVGLVDRGGPELLVVAADGDDGVCEVVEIGLALARSACE